MGKMAARSSDYACALILREGKVLLGRRSAFRKAYPGSWDVIGGRVEPGESIEAALTRELGEELGITPRDPVFFRSLEDPQMDADTPPVYHIYLVRDWEGTPHMRNHEHTHLEWFTLQQALDLANLALPEYRPLLAVAMRG